MLNDEIISIFCRKNVAQSKYYLYLCTRITNHFAYDREQHI